MNEPDALRRTKQALRTKRKGGGCKKIRARNYQSIRAATVGRRGGLGVSRKSGERNSAEKAPGQQSSEKKSILKRRDTER